MSLARLGTGVGTVALDDRVDIGCLDSGAGQCLCMDERKRQPVRERRIGVAEAVSHRDDPETRGSPVRSTFIRPPIGMTPVIGRA